MLGLIFLILIGVWIIRFRSDMPEITADIPQKISEKLDQLWRIAQESLQSRKYLRAEKALLTILRVDERNASAYNRLGILYAKQQQFKDAIECFEIAQSLEPSASSLHNVGLIYYETQNYDKAALAFEQALDIEDDLPARHIAYAKVQEKLGDTKKMFESLERAIRLEPIPQTLTIFADALERYGEPERALKVREQAARMVLPNGRRPSGRVKQPRRVVM